MLPSRQRDKLEADLAAARRRIAELEGALAKLSMRDPAVGSMLTLGAFRAQLELDLPRARRYGRSLSLAVLDIDRFRCINLKHGYGAGDLVLGAVAELIVKGTRSHDLACRVGGDEFAVLFGEAPPADARAAMERILRELEDLDAGGIRGHSASVGIAVLETGQGAEELLAAARAALEQARADGGGKAVLFADAEDPGEVEMLPTGQADVVAALTSTLGERDRYTGEHSESVVELTARVGESLALDPEEIERVRTAALLHDIGKVAIPDEVLHKPGPLDEREWEIMRRHSAIGERIVRAIPGMGVIARIVRHEHERWDGDGYPDGLAGERIPVGARIILACDAYHAMTSDRPYRAAMAHSTALSELTANAGSQFDPNVVEALVGYLYGRRQAGLAAV